MIVLRLSGRLDSPEVVELVNGYQENGWKLSSLLGRKDSVIIAMVK